MSIIVPVPSRIYKQWSVWVLAALALFDVAVGLIAVLGDQHILSPEALASVNSAAAAVALALKYVKQNIKFTEEQKEVLVEAVASAPTKPAKLEPVDQKTMSDIGPGHTAGNAPPPKLGDSS
jgi:hypothetical protein